MKAYLSQLNDRERWMVLTAAVCLIIYVYYMLLYSPLSNSVHLKSEQLIEKKDTLAWMNKVRGQNHPNASKKSITNNQLLSVLSGKLKDNPSIKYPFQLQQTSSGSIELSFESVPFTLFISYFSEFNKEYSVRVEHLEAEPTQTPGVAKLSITLTAE